jgi:hypothetical protein
MGGMGGFVGDVMRFVFGGEERNDRHYVEELRRQTDTQREQFIEDQATIREQHALQNINALRNVAMVNVGGTAAASDLIREQRALQNINVAATPARISTGSTGSSVGGISDTDYNTVVKGKGRRSRIKRDVLGI